MTSRAGEGRYEIIFKTDSESAYKKVQEACREQMGNRKMAVEEKAMHLYSCIMQKLATMRANRVPKNACYVFLTKGAIDVFREHEMQLGLIREDFGEKGQEMFADFPAVRVDEKGVKAWVGVIAADIDALERL
jgi:hypothetical protein